MNDPSVIDHFFKLRVGIGLDGQRFLDECGFSSFEFQTGWDRDHGIGILMHKGSVLVAGGMTEMIGDEQRCRRRQIQSKSYDMDDGGLITVGRIRRQGSFRLGGPGSIGSGFGFRKGQPGFSGGMYRAEERKVPVSRPLGPGHSSTGWLAGRIAVFMPRRTQHCQQTARLIGHFRWLGYSGLDLLPGRLLS